MIEPWQSFKKYVREVQSHLNFFETLKVALKPSNRIFKTLSNCFLMTCEFVSTINIWVTSLFVIYYHYLTNVTATASGMVNGLWKKIKVSYNFSQMSRVSRYRLLRGSESLDHFAKPFWGSKSRSRNPKTSKCLGLAEKTAGFAVLHSPPPNKCWQGKNWEKKKN